MHDDDDDELAASLTGLSGLLSGHRTLEQGLVRVAEFAVRAIPGADGAGLTLLEADRPQTVVATDEFVTAVDDIQYGLGEGPCISAVAQGRTFSSGNLGGEQQWPHFGPRVGRLGVHSALSLPLLLPGQVLGALNVYAHRRDVFDEHAIVMGEAFSPQAAVSVHNAQLLAQAERVVAQLQQALTSRAEIDQALGVMMSRTGATALEAFDKLREMSQSQSVKLTEVAREVLGQAVRRARVRHADPPANPSSDGPET
jgi:GAF domain-containing protein